MDRDSCLCARGLNGLDGPNLARGAAGVRPRETSPSSSDVAAAVDLVLAALAVATAIWMLTAGDTLGRRAGDDRIGLAEWDVGVVLAIVGAAVFGAVAFLLLA